MRHLLFLYLQKFPALPHNQSLCPSELLVDVRVSSVDRVEVLLKLRHRLSPCLW